ncbi:MAG: MgtC/SapB family protein [Betaproteobacteria bacterium]|nr:MgtC/SapB family protein [Betaproteobacteria bacterium]
MAPLTTPDWLHPEGVKIVLVLFLSFLVGLEREEHKTVDGHYGFGGVRTFPLIGLIGYAMAFLSGTELLPLALGFAAVAGFLMLSYWHKLTAGNAAGVTSEMSGLATYLVGALVYHGQFWIATTISVASVLLLELKGALEGLTTRIARDDILSFTKFLLLTAVILPVVPDRAFAPFDINPFKTWLVVTAVSGVSYGSYVLQRATRGHGGVLLAAVLGGAYSSTVTTVALARRASREAHPQLFAGAILLASGVMYLRLAVLLWLFNRELMGLLAPDLLVLAAVGIVAGWAWSRREGRVAQEPSREYEPRNPLELGTAFLFAALFLAMLVGTHLAIAYLGQHGVYLLAALMGVADVDPFIMSMTQAAPAFTPLQWAAAAILIAAASNNLVKGIYAYALAPRAVGAASLGLLAALAALGLAPLLW